MLVCPKLGHIALYGCTVSIDFKLNTSSFPLYIYSPFKNFLLYKVKVFSSIRSFKHNYSVTKQEHVVHYDCIGQGYIEQGL